MSAPLPAGIGVAEGPRGPCPPKVLEHIVICALRGGITNKMVLFALNQTFWTPPNFCPPNFWAGYATVCRGKLPNFRADCFTVGLYRVIMTWLQIFKCLLQVTMLGVLSHVTLGCRHLGR